MVDIIMENIVNIIGALVMTLIGVLGAWLSAKIGKKTELGNIASAQQEVIRLAQLTVGELQQTVVDGLKASREDGKLTKEEIAALGVALVQKTIEKMSAPTQDLLNAAGVDIVALIHGAGEYWINQLKEINK